VKTANGTAATPLPSAAGKRVAVVSAAFYGDLAEQLEDGARRGLAACGVASDAIAVHRVPGCFELPLAARLMADAGYDAIVALGVVVRGDTPHFEYVAGECSRGIMDVQLATKVPIGFGVLTTETLAQAEERADPARGDKGYEAAVAALTVSALAGGVRGRLL
jgi:6,7-dimethyl-8-ribityllumazine synthase